jgi:Fe-S-cluster containining protein
MLAIRNAAAMAPVYDNRMQSSQAFNLCLQPEVAFDGARLKDSLTGHVHELKASARHLVRALDGSSNVSGVLERAARIARVPEAELEREVRQLLLLGLIRGSCQTARTRLALIRNGETLQTRVLPGSRVACQGSGACCRGYILGPIGQTEKQRIEALNPRSRLSYLTAEPLFEIEGERAGEVTYRLALRGDVCVFLDSNARCGLHAAFGTQAKPALCQLFPLAALATIDGLKVFDRGECANFAAGALHGAAVAAQIPAVLHDIEHRLYHPVVTIHHRWRCDYGMILMLTRRLDQELCSRPPLRALCAIGQQARSLIVALVRCPLESGEPELAASAALEAPLDETTGSGVEGCRTGLRRIAELAGALRDRVAAHETHSPAFTRAAGGLAQLALALLEPTLSSRSATRVQLDDSVERCLTLSLRQQIFGQELLLEESLPAGLLRMVLVILLTLLAAQSQAAQEGRHRVSMVDLSLGHMVVKRTLNRPLPRELLIANGEQAWPILDALPAFIEHFEPNEPSAVSAEPANS